MATYHNIIFLNDYEDETVAAFLAGDQAEFNLIQMIDYLNNWDYGSENEHSPQSEPSHGTSDDYHQSGEYILSWNNGLGYVGLDREDRS